MIYDRLLTVCTLDPDSGPRKLRLVKGRTYCFGEAEVFASRFYAAKQAGTTVDRLVELWRADIRPDQFAQLWDEPEEVYRIVQVQHGQRNGLDVTTLSLKREEVRYELASN